MNQTMI